MTTPPVDRRGFLRRSWQVGALLAGTIATGVALDDRSHPRPTVTPATTTSAPTHASDAAWRALGGALTGRLIRPSSPTYATDRLLYNTRFTDLHPQALAYCANRDDVARCVEFATTYAVPLTSRSGGHSYGGYSSCEGLVIDVTTMNAVAVDTRANTARVGAGARLIDVYNAIGARQRLLPAGSCPTVGVAGLTLGGGVGVFSRKYGMTCDNLRSVDVVTADSTHVVASGNDRSDLLWASQGGGGGNFGVATSFEFTIHPLPRVTLFSWEFPWAASGAVLSAWLQWMSTMPDELWSDCQMLSQGTAGLTVQVNGVFCGDPGALASLLASLRSLVGVAPTSVFAGSDDYIAAMMNEAGCAGLSVASCHLAARGGAGTRQREGFAAKSSYVDQLMDDAAAAKMVTAVEHLQSVAPLLGGGLAFDSYGGAINQIASDETAFVHRNKLAGIQATYSWSPFTSLSERAAGQRWLTFLGTTVLDPSSGAYQNYIDPTLPDWARAYYGTNLARLTSVKRRYDPANLFHFAQSIPLH